MRNRISLPSWFIAIFLFLSSAVFSQAPLSLHQNGSIIELNKSQFLGQTLPNIPLVESILIGNSGNSVLRNIDIKHSKNLKIRNKYFEIAPGKVLKLFVEFNSRKKGFFKEYIAFNSNQIAGNDFIELEIEVLDPDIIENETQEIVDKYLQIDFTQPELFNNTKIGSIVEYTFKATNIGPRSINISELACTNPYSLTGDQLFLKPGESSELKLKFSPNTTGHQNGLARITSNNPNFVKIIEITGQAIWGYDTKYLEELNFIIPPDSSDKRLIINLGKIYHEKFDIILAEPNGNPVWGQQFSNYSTELINIPIGRFNSGVYSLNVVDRMTNEVIYSQNFELNSQES